MMIPYFYKIRHIKSNRVYVGSQYGKNSNPLNFWKTYFTSSKEVGIIIQNEGTESFEIKRIIVRDDARKYEKKYLSRMYSMLGREKFLAVFINRNLSPGILLTDDIIDKINHTKKKNWDNGKKEKPTPPNWKGKRRSNEMREKLRLSKLGHSVSDDTRKKLSVANSGKKQSSSTKNKRAASLQNCKSAYNREVWLFVSPEGKYHYTVGRRNEVLHLLGLSEGPGFRNYVNTEKSPSNGKNVGWKFYRGEIRILNLIKGIEGIIYHYV